MGTGWTSVGWRAQTGRGCASVCVGAHVGGDESGCIECEYLSDSVSDRCTGGMWLSLPCTDLIYPDRSETFQLHPLTGKKWYSHSKSTTVRHKTNTQMDSSKEKKSGRLVFDRP